MSWWFQEGSSDTFSLKHLKQVSLVTKLLTSELQYLNSFEQFFIGIKYRVCQKVNVEEINYEIPRYCQQTL